MGQERGSKRGHQAGAVAECGAAQGCTVPKLGDARDKPWLIKSNPIRLVALAVAALPQALPEGSQRASARHNADAMVGP